LSINFKQKKDPGIAFRNSARVIIGLPFKMMLFPIHLATVLFLAGGEPYS
jgi:hypothetical protein